MSLNTKFLGRNIEYYEKIDSTQLEVWRRINKKQMENGTHGRIWHTDERNNIAFSFYIKSNCDISRLDGMTTEVAETILEVLKKTYNINLKIKKPNDIIYNNKKIGGILCETKIVGEKVKAIVIGIGINTNKKDFPEDIKQIASSILNEFNIIIDNKKVIEEFCNIFENRIIRRIGENL